MFLEVTVAWTENQFRSSLPEIEERNTNNILALFISVICSINQGYGHFWNYQDKLKLGCEKKKKIRTGPKLTSSSWKASVVQCIHPFMIHCNYDQNMEGKAHSFCRAAFPTASPGLPLVPTYSCIDWGTLDWRVLPKISAEPATCTFCHPLRKTCVYVIQHTWKIVFPNRNFYHESTILKSDTLSHGTLTLLVTLISWHLILMLISDGCPLMSELCYYPLLWPVSH